VKTTTIDRQKLIAVLADAIATKEGFFGKNKSGIPAVSQRLNNPGCLRAWKNAAGHKMPRVNGLVQFATEADGFRALRAQCKINVFKRGLTLVQFFCGKPGVYYGFAAKTQGQDPDSYITFIQRFMVSRLGVSFAVNVPINSLLGKGAF